MSLMDRLKKYEMTNQPREISRESKSGSAVPTDPQIGRGERVIPIHPSPRRTFSNSISGRRSGTDRRHQSVVSDEPIHREKVEPTIAQDSRDDSDHSLAVKARIHSEVLDLLPADILVSNNESKIRNEVERLLNSIVNREMISLSRAERDKLFREIMAEITGLGPLEELMADEEITEIMVNGPHKIYIEKAGKVYPTGRRFRDDNHLLRIIHRIIAPLNRRLDESNPMVDARLPDGSRVNAVIPPISLIGPVLSIHKFYREQFTVEDLIANGTITRDIARFLEACVRARLDIMISGGTSTGKTTFLNVLSSFIPESERLITIEDAAELRLSQEHVITLEARPASASGRGEITIRDLVRNALRMRPDRIIIGEVRGGEALDLLQAMNTGHEGSMSTCHANTPFDMISRLETMALMSGIDLPERAIREQIAGALDIIIQMGRFSDGTRKVVKITEVQGMQGDYVSLHDIFVFKRRGIDAEGRVIGEFVSTGIKPSFLQSMIDSGFDPSDLGIW